MEKDQAPKVMGSSLYASISIESPHRKDEPLIPAPNIDTITNEMLGISASSSIKENTQCDANINSSPGKIRKSPISRSAPILPEAKTMLHRLMRRKMSQ